MGDSTVRRRFSAALTAAWLLVFGGPTTAKAPGVIKPIPDDLFEPVTVKPATIDDFPLSPPPARPRTPEPTAPVIVRVIPPPEPVLPTVADAKAYALAVLGAEQYECLNQIAIHESNWNPLDVNPTSGAAGIFQALPPEKQKWAGDDWAWNPLTQTKFGIHYVNVRYGSACAAWAFWRGHRWY